jgi:hypothetical protein
MPENNFGFEPMLEIKTDFKPSDNQLNKLAESMAIDLKKIPAGYTYLGQFIDHDMSLDSANRTLPWDPTPRYIFNKRTPFLNLETIYGFECPSNPEEPARADLMKVGSKTLLKLGNTVKGLVNKIFLNKDLPRLPDSPIAHIVDQRNDENLAVAQTQVAFMRFHNVVVKYLTEKFNEDDTVETFEKARKIVIQHYQWIILKDYLPRIIKQSVLNDILASGNQFYFPNPESPFMPSEFSFAAFRAAHSMIRNSYNWNIVFNNDNPAFPASLIELTKFTGRCGLRISEDFPVNKNLPSEWLINWNWFYRTTSENQGQKFNFALEINTKIARQLGFLPAPGAGCNFPEMLIFKRESSLAAFDLYRTRALNLPTGQEVAKTILGAEERILKPEQIANLLPASLKYAFSKETPLWFYLLAEAEVEERGQNLGEVGSRIIAETFVELIKLSEFSILDDFQPIPDFSGDNGEFGMPQMLKFINDNKDEDYDELNPLKDIDLCEEEIKKAIGDFVSNQKIKKGERKI